MKNEQSINIQKKTIIFLSLAIIVIFSLIYYRENKIIKNEEINIAINDVLPKLITVERNEDDLIIEEKNVKLLSASYITEEPAQTVEESKEAISNNVDILKDDIIIEDTDSETLSKENELVGKYKNVLEVTATAYCLCEKCCGKAETDPEYGVTASGLKIIPNTNMKIIAVDPKVIPLNSKVYVEGLNGSPDYGYAIAADTGGAIKNKIIDLYMDSHAETNNWGRRPVRVYILED